MRVDHPTDVMTGTVDFADTTPAPPTSGIELFSRWRARRLPSAIGPTGQDTWLQPHFATNHVSMWYANGGTLSGSDGIQNFGSIFAVTGTAGNGVISAASLYASLFRGRATSATAATGINCGLRSNTQQWHLSSTANKGGFHYVSRWGLATVASGTRGFMGMSTTGTAIPLAADPSSLFSLVGFGWDAADTNLQFMYNDASGTATKVSCGASFPVTTGAATNVYECHVFSASGAGQSVYWAARRINDNAVAYGATPITTNLPANDSLLSAHLAVSTGTQTVAQQLEIMGLYIDSDN